MAGTNINSLLQENTSLPVETEQQIPEKKISEDVLTIEFNQLDKMMSSKCDYITVLAQIYKVMAILHRIGRREDKSYALDKEIVMKANITEIKETYNDWIGFSLICVSSGLSFASGGLSIAGAFPGTIIGDALGKLPGLSIFGDAAGTKTFKLLSGGTSSFSQGAGMFEKYFDKRGESSRTVLNYDLQQHQRKQEDRIRSSNDEAQQGRDDIRNLGQVINKEHETASQLNR